MAGSNQYRIYIGREKVGETPYANAALVLAEVCSRAQDHVAEIKFCGAVVFNCSEFAADSCMIVATDDRDCRTLHKRSMDALLYQ